VGLAIRGFVKLGTADQTKGLGTGKTAVGLDLLLSKSLGHVADDPRGNRLPVQQRPRQPEPGRNRTRAQLGRWLEHSGLPNLPDPDRGHGASYEGAAFAQTNPVDLIVGPVFWIKGFFIRPAVSRNLNFNDRGLNSRARSYTGWQFSIGYHPGTACCAITTPRRRLGPRSTGPPTVTCEAERPTVAPGETVGLRAIASDPDGRGLSYSWTTSAGRIVGANANVRLDTAGVRPPANHNRHRASHRWPSGRRRDLRRSHCRTRAADRDDDLRVGRLPPNLARLNNVDKACLDDVASRLRQDPRSRVIVVGHADGAERRPALVAVNGRKRPRPIW
jgi:hypothetical protein